MLVDDYRFSCNVDTLLRTNGITQLAADAAFAHVVAHRFFRRFPDGEAVTDDVCRVADVKILAVRFVQAEHLQRRAGVAGIDGLHIGIFLKNFIQLLTADVFDFTSQGNRDFVSGGR